MSGMTIDRFQAERVGPPPLPQTKPEPQIWQPDKPTFSEHLKKACDEIGCRTQFSGHAQARIVSRNIVLAPEQLVRIDKAVDSAAARGANKALVMLDDLALIVGVNNRTVITMVDQPALRENVFTAIDAAVIA